MSAAASTTDHIRRAWDSIAPGFDDFVSPVTMPFGAEVVERLGVGPGTRFLDAAAGSGALAIPAARRGAETTAVDLAPTMIERLAARATAERLSNLKGQIMDGEALDLPDDTFDVAASLNGVVRGRGARGSPAAKYDCQVIAGHAKTREVRPSPRGRRNSRGASNSHHAHALARNIITTL